MPAIATSAVEPSWAVEIGQKTQRVGPYVKNQIVTGPAKRMTKPPLDPFKIAGQPRAALQRQGRRNPVEPKRLNDNGHLGFGSIWMHPMDNSHE